VPRPTQKSTQRPTQAELTRNADERAQQVYRAHARGLNFKKIGAEFGISRSRARQLTKRGQDLLRRKDNPLNELSTRVRNVLYDNKCGQTPEEISQWFAAQPLRHLRTIVNFGAGSQKELSCWLARHGQQPLKEA